MNLASRLQTVFSNKMRLKLGAPLSKHKLLIFILCLALLIAIPFLTPNMYVLHVIILVLYYVVLAVSLDLR